MKSIFKDRIKFHIKAGDIISVEEVFALIQTIRKKYPNAEISVEVERE